MAENLLNMTQNFMTPDFLNKFSRALGQSSDKVQADLKAVLPTFIMAMISKGSTTEGAQKLVNIVDRQGLDHAETPSNFNDINYLKKGNEVVNGVFGNNLISIISGLGSTTGMNASNVSKMLGMIAPVVMGVFGSKVKKEGMSVSNVMGFLNQQKSAIAAFIPGSITATFGGRATGKARDDITIRPRDVYVRHGAEKKSSWGLIALLAFIGLALFWFLTRHSELNVVTTPSEAARQATTHISKFIAPGASLGELESFLQTAPVTELPKRFRFDQVKFDLGTSGLSAEAIKELDDIATAMKANPKATARIEGFTDNTGPLATNEQLSLDRASAVKKQLVSRGIADERLEVMGRGPESPLADNETQAGRAVNRRIEFVVTGIK